MDPHEFAEKYNYIFEKYSLSPKKNAIIKFNKRLQNQIIKEILTAYKDLDKSDKLRVIWLLKQLNGSSVKHLEKMQKNMQGAGTEPEKIMRSILKELKIKYSRQKIIGTFIVDFYVPDSNLVIECDGDYWHKTEKGIERDKRKNEFLLSHDYKLLRFWESELKNNRILVTEKIKQSTRVLVSS